MERIVFQGEIPSSFFEIRISIYQNDSFYPSENPTYILELFKEEAQRNEIIIYTDHKNIRLVGFFPENEDIAYAGFWETTHDLGLNHAVFELFFADIQQKNRRELIMPINFNTYQSYRLPLNTPIWKLFSGEPSEPLYYSQILLELGFDIHTHFESRMLRKEHVSWVYQNKQEVLSTLSGIPFNIIPLYPDIWQKYEKEIFVLIDAIFSANPFYKKISWEQFSKMYHYQFAEKLCPYSSVLFQEKSTNSLAAISLCLPHYGYSTKTKGNFKEDYPNLSPKILLAKSVGVHPNFRGQNLMNYLAAYAMLSFQDYYDDIIFCTMRSDNISLRFSDAFPHETSKYALFSKKL
ncbi:MAG: hypothetical protein MUC49_04020 [Raineya sp.]|jgi:hypothetical protein|nr:hypothetical protein [Raineya sp.]